jgi:hypothetical protein
MGEGGGDEGDLEKRSQRWWVKKLCRFTTKNERTSKLVKDNYSSPGVWFWSLQTGDYFDGLLLLKNTRIMHFTADNIDIL